ncbi:MAG TPA: efflux RND transporter periplasmic adaptor subunit [Acidobacteriaceae bacterium]|nr:efflux RND transporter periplasmic adaptor subunit [Acidobacteriaceae bacterium]
MAEESKQKSRVWLWVGAGVVLVIVFFIARWMARDQVPVRAASAARAELINTVSTNGIVEPIDKVEFHSPLATSVRKLYVQEGQHVKAGQLLMQLDDSVARARVATAESALHTALASQEAITHGGTLEERQSMSASVTRDQLDLTQKQQALASLEKLHATGAASQAEVDAAKQRLALAQDTLATDQGRQTTRYSPVERGRATAGVADAQANLAAAQAVLAQTTIKAPIDGTVYSVPVTSSDFVEEGKLLLQMADLKQQRVRAYFDEPDIGKLAVGQKIRIVWDAYPGREWHGHVTSIPSTVVSYNTRNVGEVLVAIDDVDDTLLPETHVTVTVTTSSAPNTLTVPREALHSEGGKAFVYRIISGDLVRTDVKTGTANLTQVPILSGLNEGDVVATTSMNGVTLEDGLPVKVVR